MHHTLAASTTVSNARFPSKLQPITLTKHVLVFLRLIPVLTLQVAAHAPPSNPWPLRLPAPQHPCAHPTTVHQQNRFRKTKRNGATKRKTYNSRDSLLVTHATTNRPQGSLSMEERTGFRVFYLLWSYVKERAEIADYELHAPSSSSDSQMPPELRWEDESRLESGRCLGWSEGEKGGNGGNCER